jgi:hypothetical protein
LNLLFSNSFWHVGISLKNVALELLSWGNYSEFEKNNPFFVFFPHSQYNFWADGTRKSTCSFRTEKGYVYLKIRIGMGTGMEREHT